MVDNGEMLTLMSKVKTLNETLWEGRASEPSVRQWLANFSDQPPPTEVQQLHALYLLSNFMYFGSRQIRELLKAMYRDSYRYPIVERLRRSNSDTIDSGVIDPLFASELKATRFLGMGNPSESGCHLLYYFRQENALPKDLFIHTHQIFASTGSPPTHSLRDPAIKRYVFVDDFCGTGKQGIEYSKDVVEAIKLLQPSATACYYVLFATKAGIANIRSKTVFDDVRATYELDDSFRAFSHNSRIFRTPPSGIDRATCESMCRTYGSQMLPTPHCLGFDDGQLLIGFHHNTPDNSLPVIWCDGSHSRTWFPIFRRYPKLSIW